jgi:superfamily I DNA and RNA helicase
MEFLWSDPSNTNYAEKEIWNALKLALINDEGICYHRYPVFSADRSRREPDILILHREWGMYIIECKGFKIENIESIDGSVWKMKNWHSDQETPYTQAEDQMWAVMGKFKNESGLRRKRECVIQGHTFIGLPFIRRAEWMEKSLGLSPASPNTLIFADDLEPEALRKRLQAVPAEETQQPMTEEQWRLSVGVLQGAPALRREARPQANGLSSKASMLRQVEQQIETIDREQMKVALQVPSGPQRIRGLSGSGKTVVLCMKAASMHSRFPNWDIAYTFYTRSLYGMIKGLITRFYRYWVDQDPNWNKLHVLHGWGAKDSPGFYRLIAGKMSQSPRSYNEAEHVFSYTEQNQLLGKCCEELRKSSQKIPELFDAILIDEGQDFHFEFYKLCHQALREPKRLIWAYDDVQSLESLSVPTAIDIFGTSPDGSPLVSLEGTYPDGEIEKDLILHRCYRTPRPILVMAHIFGMGLLRPGGAVQFIPTSGGWEDIGYEVISGSFKPGQELTIKRPEANSPHALEKIAGYRNLVQSKAFPNRSDELSWVTDQIAANISKDELMPEEIMVISLDWRQSKTDFFTMKQLLMQKGINAIRPGLDVPSNIFQQKDNVTLTNIFPAKGNEASVVYVMGFEQVGSHPKIIVQERNQAFTAMTRTRGWCILTGVGGMAETLFDEIRLILTDPDKITFKVPDPKTIQRNLDNLEYERRRNRIKRADGLFTELKRVLAEIDDPEVRRKYIEELRGTR